MHYCCAIETLRLSVAPKPLKAKTRGSAHVQTLKENTAKFLKTLQLNDTAHDVRLYATQLVSVENNSHSQQERRAHLRFEGLALSERKKGSAPSGCASKQARALTHIREEEAEDREDLPLRESLSSCCLLASIFSSETRMISSVRSSPCSISAWNWST